MNSFNVVSFLFPRSRGLLQSSTSTAVEVKHNVPVTPSSLKSSDQLPIGEVSARSGVAVGELPDSAGELVAAQVDALEPHQRTVLRYASVLGMTFDADQLQMLVEGKADARAGLEALRYFVLREGEQYRFEQALVQIGRAHV